jgi:hypothetical protein
VSHNRFAETMEVLRSTHIPSGDNVLDIVHGPDRFFELGAFSWNGWVCKVSKGGKRQIKEWGHWFVHQGRGDWQVRRHDRGCIARHVTILGTGRKSGIGRVRDTGGNFIFLFAISYK